MTLEEKNLLIISLEEELREASQKYYEGDDIMSDTEFDSKWSYLQELDPNNLVFTEISKGYKLKGIDDKEKFEHLIPVGSVDKVTVLEVLKKWLKPNATFTTKIDGNSIVAYYNDGFLKEVVTRGSENIGIIRTAKFISKLKTKIDVPGSIAVRGEAAIKRAVYKNNKCFDQTKASRNAVAGAITRKENYKEVMDHVDVVFYTFIDCETGEDISSKYEWDKWFNVEEQKPLDDFINLTLEAFKKKYKDDYEYEADGIVFKNPDGSLIAFKFEDEKICTKLLDVQWTIGKDQRLTPVAILEEVSLCGANIARASMGSYSRAVKIKAWPVHSGHIVEIKRANEVIPYVTRVISINGDSGNIAVECPVCGCIGETNGEHLFCKNKSCGNINQSRLLSFSEEFYPEGLSNTTVEKFFSAYGINTVNELLDFQMPKRKIEIYGVGDSAYNLFQTFLKNISNDLDVRVIYKTYINSVGDRASKKIVDSGFDINLYITDPIKEIRKLGAIPNFNSKIALELLEKHEEISDIIPKRTWVQTKSVKTKGTFCVTGVRFKPDQLAKILELGWGEDDLKKTTDVLVTKDPNSASSKVQKAKKYGIQIMTIDAFMQFISN